ncbi:MAG: hypothetical protein ACKVH1_08305, partial [Alphaproteobacteria bacterium]
LQLVRVAPATGRPARPGTRRTILEAFLPGTVPTRRGRVLDGSGGGGGGTMQPASGVASPARKLRDLY